MNKLIYNIRDHVPFRDLMLYGFQQMMAILTATILISTICGTSVPAGLVAGGVSTLIFLSATGFRCPLFVSNSGATVSAVVGVAALTKSVEQNCTGVLIGGIVIFLMNAIGALLIKRIGTGWVDKALPPVVIGCAIMIIGVNLMKFIPTYVMVDGEYSPSSATASGDHLAMSRPISNMKKKRPLPLPPPYMPPPQVIAPALSLATTRRTPHA